MPYIHARRTALRISGERTRERALVDDWPLQSLEDRRDTPNRKRMVTRNADGAARSVRAIGKANRRAKSYAFYESVFRDLLGPNTLLQNLTSSSRDKNNYQSLQTQSAYHDLVVCITEFDPQGQKYRSIP